MTTTTAPTSTAIAVTEPVFSTQEQLALAGFLAGYTGLTREAYALDLRQFTAWCQLHHLRLFQARRADIECFARDLEARGRARATVTRRLCTVAGFYRYAVEEELLGHSPAAHVRRPRLDYESHATGLDRNELGAILVTAGLGAAAEHALISLLALNGLRVSEATGADIESLGVERGHRTLVVSRKGGKVVTIPLAPLNVVAVVADLSDPAGVEDLVTQVDELAGPVDILVNNAGVGDQELFDQAQWSRTRQVLHTNVLAVARLTAALVPSMVQRGRGGVLNLGSGLTVMPAAAAYSASKHFIDGFSEGLRADLAGTGVVVTQVCPGPVDSEFDQSAGSAGGMTGGPRNSCGSAPPNAPAKPWPALTAAPRWFSRPRLPARHAGAAAAAPPGGPRPGSPGRRQAHSTARAASPPGTAGAGLART